MNAIQFLQTTPLLPASREGVLGGPPSNSELRRWLKKGSVIVNGVVVVAGDEIAFPIEELIFFRGSKSQTTVLMSDSAWETRSKDTEYCKRWLPT